MLKPFWVIVLSSVIGVSVGILFRKFLEKQKLLAIFIPLFLYLLAEYMAANAAAPETKWVILGGEAAMVFLGVTLPSVLIPWNIKWK